MNETIISLCYVSSRRDRSVELCRIADYIDGALLPYNHDRDSDFSGNDRDLIYASANEIRDEQGSISVYEWSAYLDEYQSWRTRTVASNVPWIEVVQLKCITSDSMLSQLKRGWAPDNGFDGKHDVIFCSTSFSSSSVIAIYVPSYAFEFVSGKWYISDAVSSLESGRIDFRSDTHSCSCRYSRADGRRFLRCIDAWKPNSKLLIKNVDEIITGIVQSTISGMGLSRKERQLTRNALESLDHNYVIENIMQKLGCPAEEAKEQLHDFLASRSYRLDHDEAVDIMEKLIAIDSGYVSMLREKVKKEWEREQAALIQEALKKVEDKRKALHSIEEKMQIESAKIEEAKQKQLEIQLEVEESIRLKNDVEQQIAERLQNIRDDRAAALVDSAFLQAAVQPASATVSVEKSAELPSCITMDIDGEKEERQLREAVPDILDACAEICGDEQDACEEMTLFLLAAFACNQPLLLVGETALEVADLYAVSATGHKCIKVRSSDDHLPIDSLVFLIQGYPTACVCIVDGLEKGYDMARELMRRLPETRFVLTANHMESLLMEPESLYSTFIPVATDLFCESGRVKTWPAANCFNALSQLLERAQKSKNIREIRVKQKRWLGKGFVSPLMKNRYAILQSCIQTLSGEMGFGSATAVRASRLYLYLTRMRIQRNTEELKALLEEGITLSKDRATILRAFADILEE